MKAAIAIIVLVVLLYIGYQDFLSGDGVFASMGATPANLIPELEAERVILAKAYNAAKSKASDLYAKYQTALANYVTWDRANSDCFNRGNAWCFLNHGMNKAMVSAKLQLAAGNKLTAWTLSSNQYQVYKALEEQLAALDKKIAILVSMQEPEAESA